jgi:hypothetical protein
VSNAELTGRESTARSFKFSIKGMLIPLRLNELLGGVDNGQPPESGWRLSNLKKKLPLPII